VLAACGGGGDTASVPATNPVQSDDAATADEQPADDTDAAAAFAQVFAAATPLNGASFDGATLAGTDAVVWFWAPWCTICRGEAPEVAEVARRYADRVQVVGVPGRGEIDAMREFVDDTGTGAITHLADIDGSIWSAFGVYGQPAYAFLDDSGTVDVFIGGMGGDALADRIDQLLAA
jgi:thiol-disulfide isomerase/thioredoxin